MKYLLTLVFFLSVAAATGQQTLNSSYATNGFMEAYDMKGKPLTSKPNVDVEGSPLLNEQWAVGEVRLTNGHTFKQVALQFNLLENELYFRKDGEVYVFANPVREFTFPYVREDKSLVAFFRKGYPAAGNKTEATYYEVLADGSKLHLLKFRSKKIRQSYQYGGPAKKVYQDAEELFVYDAAANKLLPVSKSKSALTDALPHYAAAISQWAKEKSASLKTEEEIIQLVQQLNQ